MGIHYSTTVAYEMYALEGATAIVNKVKELGLTDEAGIEWVKWWWSLNTKEQGYDYKQQMELIPDFGDGHSGNTAGFAYAFALKILEGSTDL